MAEVGLLGVGADEAVDGNEMSAASAGWPTSAQSKLVTASDPQMVPALICADDLGAAAVAVVADPATPHEAEIELAGDALSYPQMAEILTAAPGRGIAADVVLLEERERESGSRRYSVTCGTTAWATPCILTTPPSTA